MELTHIHKKTRVKIIPQPLNALCWQAVQTIYLFILKRSCVLVNHFDLFPWNREVHHTSSDTCTCIIFYHLVSSTGTVSPTSRLYQSIKTQEGYKSPMSHTSKRVSLKSLAYSLRVSSSKLLPSGRVPLLLSLLTSVSIRCSLSWKEG